MKRVLVLPGDGIGPEVMVATLRVLNALELDLAFEHDLVGGAAYDAEGCPLPARVTAAAREADAVLFGAVGGPKWDGVPYDRRPEIAIIGLRRELDLFANLRPARVFPGMEDASPLKPELIQGLDILIVRESTGGVYFGEPRGITPLPSGGERGFNTDAYSTPEVERVARVSFTLARGRSGRVTSVDKANVMESGVVWRRAAQELRDREFPDVALDHMYADNCAMQLARDPRRFDVVLTSNLFGDLLSDLAAACAGSLGLLPSATLGLQGPDGRQAALYEPIHGSAPDIAGTGTANPVAQVMSAAMMLRLSLGFPDQAHMLERACTAALARVRTPDVAVSGLPVVGTDGMADAVIVELRQLRLPSCSSLGLGGASSLADGKSAKARFSRLP